MKYIVTSIILLCLIIYIQSCTVGDLNADPSDCSRYSVCESNVCNESQNLTVTCNSYTYFDPIAKVCSLNYTCPANKVPKPIECTCANTFISDPTDPASYFVCIPRYATPLLAYRHSLCNPGLVFDAKAQACVNNDGPDDVSNCPAPETTLQDAGQNCLDGETLKIKPLNFSQPCEVEGIFPAACCSDRFYVCQKDDCGNLIKVPRICNLQRLFCPRKRYCTTCPFKQLCSAEVRDFVCPRDGNFPDPTCKFAYYICFQTYHITLVPKRLQCYKGQVFDPINNMCNLPSKVCTSCRKRIRQCN